MTVEPLNFRIQYRDGSHEGSEPPAFCRACGRPMRVTVEPRRYDPFDERTGERQMERHARCTRPWWAKFVGFHDHAVEDEHHDWPWL